MLIPFLTILIISSFTGVIAYKAGVAKGKEEQKHLYDNEYLDDLINNLCLSFDLNDIKTQNLVIPYDCQDLFITKCLAQGISVIESKEASTNYQNVKVKKI